MLSSVLACGTERGGGDHRCHLALRNTWYRLAYQCSLLYGWGVTQCWKLLRDAGKCYAMLEKASAVKANSETDHTPQG